MNSLLREIGEVEARVAGEREALAEACMAWVEHTRNELVSGRGLALVVAAGFVLGKAMRSRPAPPRKAGRGIVGVLVSLAAGLLRARYGHPWAAFERLFAAKHRAGSA